MLTKDLPILNLPNDSRIPTCGECTIKLDFVPSEGSNDPDYLFLGEAPGYNEAQEHRPFVGIAGRLLRKLINESGVENFRITNSVACRPTDIEKNNRTPDEQEVRRCFNEFAANDILRTKPKIIIAVGGVAFSALFPDLKLSVGEARTKTDLRWNNIPVRVIYHSSFISRTGGENSTHYGTTLKDLRRAVDFINGVPSKEEIQPKRILLPYELPEVLNKIWSEKVIYYDLESTYCAPYMKRFKLASIGFTTSTESYYVRLCDTDGDHLLTEEVRSKFESFMMSRDSIEVFNAGFERPATIKCLGFDIKDKVYDLMQAGIALNIQGSLKEICGTLFGVSDWSSKIDEWLNAIVDAIKLFIKNKKHLGDLLNELETRQSLYDLTKTLDEMIQDCKEDPRQTKAILSKIEWLGKIKDPIIQILNLIEELYGFNLDRIIYHDKYYGNLIRRKVLAHEDYLDYTELPWELVGPYNFYDTINTRELGRHFHSELKKRNCEEAASLYNEHMKLAVNIESAGIVWDDDKAETLKKMYDEYALDSLRNLILHPKMIESLGLNDAQKLAAATTQDEKQLQNDFFNPNSNHKNTLEKFEKAFITIEYKVGLLIYKLRHLKEKEKKYYPFLLNFVKEKKADQIQYYKLLLDIILQNTNSPLTPSETKLARECACYRLTTLASEEVEVFFDVFTNIMGIDVEDRKTWTPEFDLMYRYRLYKKVTKSRNTYINGSVGRGGVFIADKDEVINSRIPSRLRPYGPKADNEVYLLQPSNNVCRALTKRWKASLHVIPWGAELRDIHVSRFPGGMICHYDCSQNEVKYLAAMSKDEGLLALVNSSDVHRGVAAKIWRKDAKDVTSAERRYAKMSTFSILYGKTVEGFADEFMGGRIEDARAMFDNFFVTFPKVKEYIEESHRQWEETGEVKTLFGDTIVINCRDRENPEEVNSCKRQAQNYRIQSSASTGAGVSIFRVDEALHGRGLNTRTFGFTHDSGDIDFETPNLIQVLKFIPIYAEELPLKLWGIPTTIDIAIGPRGNTQIDLSEIKITDDERSFSAEFEGVKEDLDATVNILRDQKFNVEYTISKEEDSYVEMKELFITRRAYSMYIGKKRIKVGGKIQVWK